jgi:hypothetical protein
MSSCDAQTRAGRRKITYRFDLVPKNENIEAASLKNIFGNGYTLIFKQGNFFHTYDGGSIEFDMYKKEDNKAYVKERGNDTIFWYDCRKPGEKINKFLFTKNKETILGIACDELMIRFDDKTESQYYNSDSILINPGWFKGFMLDGESEIDEKEKSIYLKNKIDYPYFLFTQTATKISREAIDDKIFEIPSTAILFERK